LRTSGGKIKSTSSINITEQRRLVQAVLDAIPPLHHRMIELAFFSGMTNLEIAKEVGQSPAVVEAEFQHSMLQLFGLFKSMGFSGSPGHKPKDGLTIGSPPPSLGVCVNAQTFFPLTAITR
jgi:hypothetical protein